MGISDIFNKNKLQQLEAENIELKKQVGELSAKFTPELQEVIDISESVKAIPHSCQKGKNVIKYSYG